MWADYSRPNTPPQAANDDDGVARSPSVTYLSQPSSNFLEDDAHSYDVLVRNEGVQKMGFLDNIQRTAKFRSNSELGLDNAAESPRRKISRDNDNSRLFHKIPPAYPHSTSFQKVIITASEQSDPDSVEACSKLKQCMELRKKWISKHPFPPQDMEDFNLDMSTAPAELSRGVSTPSFNTSIAPEKSYRVPAASNDFRRRKDPPYNVFNTPLPPSDRSFTFKMEKGVIMVFQSEVSSSAPTSTTEYSLSYSADSSDGGVSPILLSAGRFDKEQLPALQIPSVNLPARMKSLSIESDDTSGGKSKSICPVPSFQEFVDDYYAVSKRQQ
jgi:hypothetical protein